MNKICIVKSKTSKKAKEMEKICHLFLDQIKKR